MAAKNANVKNAKFVVRDMTKGSVRLDEVNADGSANPANPICGGLYLRRAAVGDMKTGTVVEVAITLPS